MHTIPYLNGFHHTILLKSKNEVWDSMGPPQMATLRGKKDDEPLDGMW